MKEGTGGGVREEAVQSRQRDKQPQQSLRSIDSTILSFIVCVDKGRNPVLQSTMIRTSFRIFIKHYKRK